MDQPVKQRDAECVKRGWTIEREKFEYMAIVTLYRKDLEELQAVYDSVTKAIDKTTNQRTHAVLRNTLSRLHEQATETRQWLNETLTHLNSLEKSS